MTTERVVGVKIEIVKGDISRQTDADAIVNAANAQLRTGGGVAGAIHEAAGPELAEEARPYAPIDPGEAVITGGHKLPNDYVIHCLGPRYGIDSPADERLASCYNNALDLAEQNDIEVIAFPAISTGAFGYPIEDATRIALTTVFRRVSELKCVKNIRFVLFSDDDREIYEQRFEELM